MASIYRDLLCLDKTQLAQLKREWIEAISLSTMDGDRSYGVIIGKRLVTVSQFRDPNKFVTVIDKLKK
jgi:hypothetical protein